MNHNYPKKRVTVLTRYGSHSGTFTAAVARRRRGVAAAMERAERRAQRRKATTPAAAVTAAACGVSLVQQDSTAPCVLGKSFGCVNTTSIWAANCRGYFRCGIDGSEFACGFPPGEQSYECACDLRVSQDRQPHEPAPVYRARTVQRAAAASPINDVHMTALHEAGGVRKVVRACQGARRKELVLICVNKLGVPSAKIVRDALVGYGGPVALILAPDEATCREEGAAPCVWSNVFSWDPNSLKQGGLAQLRTHYLAVFFSHGLNVLQLDSDLVVLGNPFPHIRHRYKRVGLLAQRDAPIINTGILFAQHVRGSNESDAVVEWLLAEANNRLVWAAPGFGGMAQHANDQATFNDLVIEAAVGYRRFLHGVLIPEGKTDAGRDGATAFMKQADLDRKAVYKHLSEVAENPRPPLPTSAAEARRMSADAAGARRRKCDPWQGGGGLAVLPLVMRMVSGGEAGDPLGSVAGEAALRALRPKAGEVSPKARRSLLEVPKPNPSARAIYASASDTFFGHWSHRFGNNMAHCTAWFAARPDPCAEPKGFVHLAGYGFKPYRPMLLKLLAHRPNSSAPPLEPMEARGLCLAFQSVLSTIEDPRSGVPRAG